MDTGGIGATPIMLPSGHVFMVLRLQIRGVSITGCGRRHHSSRGIFSRAWMNSSSDMQLQWLLRKAQGAEACWTSGTRCVC